MKTIAWIVVFISIIIYFTGCGASANGKKTAILSCQDPEPNMFCQKACDGTWMRLETTSNNEIVLLYFDTQLDCKIDQVNF